MSNNLHYIRISEHETIVQDLKEEIQILREKYHDAMYKAFTDQGGSVAEGSHYDEFVATLKSKIDNLMELNADTNHKLMDCDAKLSDHMEEVKTLKESRVKDAGKIADLNATISELRQEVQTLQNEKDHMEDNVLCFHEIHESCSEGNQTMSTLLESLKEGMKNIAILYDEATAEIKSSTKLKQIASESISSNLNSAKDIKKANDLLTTENQSLKEELELIKSENASLQSTKSKYKLLKNDVEKLKFSIKEKDERISVLEKEKRQDLELLSQENYYDAFLFQSQYALSSNPMPISDATSTPSNTTKVEKTLQLKEKEIQALNSQITELKQEVVNLRSVVLNKTVEIKTLIKENSSIEKTNRQLKEQLEKSVAQVDSLHHQVINLEIELESFEHKENAPEKPRKRSSTEAGMEPCEKPKKKRKLANTECPVIMLTGFGQGTDPKYSLEQKQEIMKMIYKLGGKVEADFFDASVTHIVSPPKYRTMKCYAALITQKWVVTPDWITESFKTGSFLPCDKFGTLGTRRPYHGKKFYLSESFNSEQLMKQLPFARVQFEHILQLISSIGKGVIVDNETDADYILSASHDTETSTNKPTLLTIKSFLRNLSNEPFWQAAKN
eukprot:TRINITY_DN9063_c0_g1_i1.p1 TRINITY_DN9063_c0_g1~~TRINITY_DN9063_c0_g1_i1.p1  ORF type:complete len:615 (-),score=125.67 TRINITY_DN9063_c0_g1_i1:48-1892(-)